MRALTQDEEDRLSALLGGKPRPKLERPSRCLTLEERQGLENLLRQCRAILYKFSMRFADSEHARAHQKEARLTIEAIDEQLLKL